MPPPNEDESVFETLPEDNHKINGDELSQMTADPDYVNDSQKSEQTCEGDLAASVVGGRTKPEAKRRAKMTKEEKKRQDEDLLANGPSLERILEVIGMPCKQRQQAEPGCFYPTGELRPVFKKFYHDDILQARQQRGAGKAAGGSNQRKSKSDGKGKQQISGDDHLNTKKQVRLKLKISLAKPQAQSSHQRQPGSLMLEARGASNTTSPPKTHQGQSATILSAPSPSSITASQQTARRHYDPETGEKARTPDLTKPPSKNVLNQPRQATSQETSSRTVSAMVKCSIESCKLGNFDARQLEAHEIRLQDAQEALSRHGMWLCPYCSKKAQFMFLDHQTTEPSRRKITTKFGAAWLDDSELKTHLITLTGLVEQYTNNACFDFPGPFPRLPILDVPCIQNEEGNATDNLVLTLRKMLDIHEGVSLRAAIQETGQETDKPFWINTVLIFLIVEFIFNNIDPFENPQILKQSINYLDIDLLPSEMIQDTRIRTMTASPRPPQFANRLKLRYDKFVQLLNATMHPLVGNNSEIYEKHKAMAKAAEELNLRNWAYKHDYKPICPKLGDRFKRKEHTLYDPTEAKYEGRKILLTKMFGIKIAIGGGEWRVCQKAEVGLLPDNEGGAADTSTIPQKRHHSQVS